MKGFGDISYYRGRCIVCDLILYKKVLWLFDGGILIGMFEFYFGLNVCYTTRVVLLINVKKSIFEE